MSGNFSKFLKRSFYFREDVSFGFSITDLFFRKLLRQNANVAWAIHHTSTIHCPEKIIRGKNVFPADSPGVYINALNGVIIGDYTNIGPNVGIISTNHDFINNHDFTKVAPIEIGKFCWIGMGAIILPEVKLGDFIIVGAGSVVTKNFEGFCVIAGNPAKIIKQLNREECEIFAAGKK